MWIPGFGGEELRTYKKSVTTDAHRQVRHSNNNNTKLVEKIPIMHICLILLYFILQRMTLIKRAKK